MQVLGFPLAPSGKPGITAFRFAKILVMNMPSCSLPWFGRERDVAHFMVQDTFDCYSRHICAIIATRYSQDMMTYLVFLNLAMSRQASYLRRPAHHGLQLPLKIGLVQAIEQFPQVPSLPFCFALGNLVW